MARWALRATRVLLLPSRAAWRPRPAHDDGQRRPVAPRRRDDATRFGRREAKQGEQRPQREQRDRVAQDDAVVRRLRRRCHRPTIAAA
jgi:hypothetical protein